MACSVRCFTYGGVNPLPWANNVQLATNAEYVLKEPYLAAETLTADVAAVSSASPLSASDGVRLLRVEVQKGNVIHYEINNAAGTQRTATVNSPTLEGKDFFEFGKGYSISVLIAGSEA